MARMTQDEYDQLQTSECQGRLVDLILRARRGERVSLADAASEAGLSLGTFIKVWTTSIKPIFAALGAGSTLH
jgi:hypothetical protein